MSATDDQPIDFVYPDPVEQINLVNSLPSKSSFVLPVTVNQGKEVRVQTTALVDSGAYAVFVHHRFVKQNKLKTKQLAVPIEVFNADGSRNRRSSIEEYAWLDIAVGDHTSRQACLITDLGKKDIFLGMSYLRKHNPEIDWKAGTWDFSRCPETCRFDSVQAQVAEAELKEPSDEDFKEDEEPWIQWIDSTTELGQTMAEVCVKIAREATLRALEGLEGWEKLVPKEYHEFGDIFSKKASERMPTRKPYDHGIVFEEGAVLPRPSRNYSLTLEERNLLMLRPQAGTSGFSFITH